jgi:hypothetical protein
VQSGVVVGDSGELGIELRDVGADAAMEDLLTVAALHGGLASAAANHKNETEKDEDRMNKMTKMKLSFYSFWVYYTEAFFGLD